MSVSSGGMLLDKERLRVLILGPYEEPGLSRLKLLKTELIARGYIHTKIVLDLKTPPKIKSMNLSHSEEIYEKSIHYVKQSDVALFVFFKDLNHDSVHTELMKAIDKYQKACCSTVLIESGLTLGIVFDGFITRSGCYRSFFTSDDDLHKIARSSCWNHLVSGKCGPI